MNWLTRLWTPRKKPTPTATPAVPTALPIAADDPSAAPDARAHTLLPWLLGSASATDATLVPLERQALEALDKTLALAELPDNLLPRAAALIPQLIALVRQTSLPTPAIAERVSRDAVLSAELMRLASSSYYRAQGNVSNLEQAITLVGLQGLQTVIARVLLKPIYGASAGPLSARIAPRMWEYSEALARHSALLAVPADQPAFDAYLLGLLHGTGWTVAMCVLDRSGLSPALPPSTAWVQAMEGRAHQLFGLASQRWEITPGFTTIARDARHHPIAASSHAWMPVLQLAQQRSLDEVAPP